MPSQSSAVAVDAQPNRQAIAARTASAPGKVTGKLAAAIDFMIEEGLPWDKAAVKAELTVRAMRLALNRPHVVSYLKAKREVFRVHASTANIQRLVQMRDQDENKMAAVTAIKALEQIGESEQVSRGSQALPGLQIVIVQGAVVPTDKPMITVNADAND